MKKFLFPFIFFLPVILSAQQIDLSKIEVDKDSFENIIVIPLFSDELSSVFVVFVKKEVPLHKHEHHTEIVKVLEGKGIMTLGEETFRIKKGDFFVIPKGVAHGVRTTGKKPLKALSIQSPEFDGTDRIFLN